MTTGGHLETLKVHRFGENVVAQKVVNGLRKSFGERVKATELLRISGLEERQRQYGNGPGRRICGRSHDCFGTTRDCSTILLATILLRDGQIEPFAEQESGRTLVARADLSRVILLKLRNESLQIFSAQPRVAVRENGEPDEHIRMCKLHVECIGR